MQSDKYFLIVGVLAVATIIGMTASSAAIQRKIEITTVTTTSKERLMSVSSSDGDTSTSFKNFVYTGDEVYVVKDSFWNWHFRAGTVYAQIPDEPATCEVTLSGVRWGFLSMHQNIIAARCDASS